MTSAHRAYAGNAVANFQRMRRAVPANFELPRLIMSNDDDDDNRRCTLPWGRILGSVLFSDADGDNALRIHEFVAFGTHAILYAGVLRRCTTRRRCSCLQTPTKQQRAQQSQGARAKGAQMRFATCFLASTTCVNRAVEAEPSSEMRGGNPSSSWARRAAARCRTDIPSRSPASSWEKCATDSADSPRIHQENQAHLLQAEPAQPIWSPRPRPRRHSRLRWRAAAAVSHGGGLHKSMPPMFYSAVLGDYNRQFNIKVRGASRSYRAVCCRCNSVNCSRQTTARR